MNHHLDHAEPLLELITDYGMLMLLPKNTPMLEALATKNWTHLDNVFGTESLVDSVTHCYTDPANRGPCMDHVPIITHLELHIPTANPQSTQNFNDVDWKKFNTTLTALLNPFPTRNLIVMKEEFQ